MLISETLGLISVKITSDFEERMKKPYIYTRLDLAGAKMNGAILNLPLKRGGGEGGFPSISEMFLASFWSVKKGVV